MHSFSGIGRDADEYFVEGNWAMANDVWEQMLSRMTVRGLFHGLALEKNCLFQRAEKLLVRAWFFDGLQIELCAGPHDELRFPGSESWR